MWLLQWTGGDREAGVGPAVLRGRIIDGTIDTAEIAPTCGLGEATTSMIVGVESIAGTSPRCRHRGEAILIESDWSVSGGTAWLECVQIMLLKNEG